MTRRGRAVLTLGLCVYVAAWVFGPGSAPADSALVFGRDDHDLMAHDVYPFLGFHMVGQAPIDAGDAEATQFVQVR